MPSKLLTDGIECLPEHGTILSDFRDQVEKWANKSAVIYANETKSVTYLELQNKSRALSRCLDAEINPIIALLLPCGFEHILSVLAVLEASKTYCPLSVDYPPVKLTHLLQELGNPLIITTTDILRSVGLEYDKIYFLDVSCHQSTEQATTSYEIPNEADTAGVYFTSGSTGNPKATLIGNNALARFAKGGIARLKMDGTDESVCVLNPGFVLNIYDVLMTLLSGGTIHVAPNELRYDIPKLRKWVKSLGTVTVMFMVSSTGETFFQAEPNEFSPSFRALLVAGEKLQCGPPPDAPFKVYSAYGSTETTAISMAEVAAISPLPCPVTHTLAGTAFPDMEIYVLEQEGLKPLPNGATGEIAVASPCLSMGYLNRPCETAEKYVVLENGVRVCRTGDLGYMQPDGNLILLNRRGSQVKVAGYRFDISDLEAALLQHPSVEKAVAVLEEDETLKFHIFYKLKSHAAGKFEIDLKINEFLQDRLPHYAFPHSITKVENFPRNPNGKIDKQELLLLKDTMLNIVEPVQTSTEMTLAHIWAEVLGIPLGNIGRTDNFFSLGGTSIIAISVISKLEERYPDFHIEVFNIFRIPVLKNLAEFLEKSRNSSLEDTSDFEAEVNLFNLDFLQSDQYKHAGGILITGTTGYLGGVLLLKLLETTDSDIYCLIRASSQDEACDRLDESFRNMNITVDAKHYMRLHCVPGNISVPCFGLSELQYSDLAESVEQVYHCAAEVHWLKRYEELRQPNVLGTLEILRFLSTKKLKFLHYVSTVGVLRMLNPATQRYEMGYTQSKWVAEKLVWRAIDAGIPGIVYRPGIIGPDSELGIFNSKDFITLLFQACKSVSAYPDQNWEFPYSTVDFTANSIIEISRNLNRNCSKVFHTFQNTLSFQDFHEYFDESRMKRCSMAEWKNLIFAADLDSRAIDLIKLILSVPYSKDLTFFDALFSELKMDISNANTMKTVSFKIELLSKKEQIRTFLDSVLFK